MNKAIAIFIIVLIVVIFASAIYTVFKNATPPPVPVELQNMRGRILIVV